MKQLFQSWWHRYFSDPEAIILSLLLLLAILLVTFAGDILAPVLASIVIAYLLEGLVKRCQKMHMPAWCAVSSVYVLFIGLFIASLFFLLPLLFKQLTNLVAELPTMISRAQSLIMQLPDRYPDFISKAQVASFIVDAKADITRYGQVILSLSLSSVPGFFVTIVYLVLIPLLVFFFLWDKQKIINWCNRYLPRDRRLMNEIWAEVNAQLGNYVRGKVLEIIIVGVVSYVAFIVMGLPYAALLGVLVGLSVIIPYIGVTIVTIPVVIIAFLQWGWSAQFAYLVIVYTIICVLDANVLVPLLFSEAVNLHPVAIIVAILVFGGIWGFWGVFFAIPLATGVNAIMNAWPRQAQIHK